MANKYPQKKGWNVAKKNINEVIGQIIMRRKFHAAVNQNHYFDACTVTNRLYHDDS